MSLKGSPWVILYEVVTYYRRGQYGRLVKELAEDCGYEKIDFLDDNRQLAIGKLSEAGA